MDTPTRRPIHHDIALVVGPLVAILAAWVMTFGGEGVDDDVLSLANITLVMVAIALLAAVVDWRAGIVTSIVAALALNYFHTAPFRTLRITDRQDIVSVVVLGALGALVSLAAGARARTTIRRTTVGRLTTSAVSIRELLASGASSADVWRVASDGIVSDLGTTTVRLTSTRPPDVPTIARSAGDDIVHVPRTGAAIALDSPSTSPMWLVIAPVEPEIVADVERRTIVVLAETIEFVLAYDTVS